jgi:hypothetical protein
MPGRAGARDRHVRVRPIALRSLVEIGKAEAKLLATTLVSVETKPAVTPVPEAGAQKRFEIKPPTFEIRLDGAEY